MSPALALGGLCVAAWIYLLAGRGLFWLTRERDSAAAPPEPGDWPPVVAVVPARNEADVIERSVASLLSQDYPGAFGVVLVDDGSDDGTAARAALAAERLRAQSRLTVIDGRSPPKGWTGKLWAVAQGVERASAGEPRYLLVTDADIAHQPDVLRTLVARAEGRGLALVSLMAKLNIESAADRWLIPAFVFFFDMLFPFAWVNDPKNAVAAAAGGCMLARRDALEAAGGFAAIRGEIIDDCALAKRLKRQGPIWLGLTERSVSLRPYGALSEIGRMISRSAYAQLGYSPLNLAGVALGMTLVFIAPPALALFAAGPARWMGLCAWVAMTFAFQPMLRFYRASALLGLALPLIAAFYTGCTIDSAVQVWRGRGGMWKGRSQAMAGSA
jgi:hopene-associated glycosyltransferase HpnB